MLREVLLFNLLLCPIVVPKRRHKDNVKGDSDELGSFLISSLRDDKNLDLSMDEEYEDLRAELLAYHTALSSLTGPRTEDPAADAEAAGDIPNTRRSMKTTPCWKLGGICVKQNLCKNTRFLTEVAGCKNNLEVCCFTWNTYQITDWRDKGIGNNAFPWTQQEQVGGRGLIGSKDEVDLKSSVENELHLYNIPIEFAEDKKNHHHHSKRDRSPILVIVKPNK